MSDLPGDGPLRLGDVTLPSGRQRFGWDRQDDPLIWTTDDVVPEPGPLWQAADGAARELGLTVVILDDLGGGAEEGRPWKSNEMGPPGLGDVGDHDAWAVFKQRWNMQVPIYSLPPQDRPRLDMFERFPPPPDLEEDPEETAYFLEQVSPWGIQFPGLALAERQSISNDVITSTVLGSPPGRIGLVATGRAADVPFRIGWQGALNHFIGPDQQQGPELLSVMFRSWEDRFDARLLRLGFDTMQFLVRRPPASEPSALAVAAEHFAIAGQDSVESIRVHASQLVNNPTWNFWWD